MELLRVYAEVFVEATFRLGISIDKLGEAKSIWEDDEHRLYLRISVLEELASTCDKAELPITKMKVDHVIYSLKQFDDPSNPDGKAIAKNLNNQLLAHYLYEIRDRLIDELSTKLFLQIPHSRKKAFDNPREKWEQVIERFPDTVLDIEESARCFALSRYAAAVFHCIQIVEFGLIELGTFIGVNDPKSGWTAVSNKLDRIIKTEHKDLADFEQKHFQFLEQMQGTVSSLKNAWRNKISHAQGRLVLMTADFSPDVAEEIMIATRSFMRRLATDLPK